jgi:NitT/TauT family transport system substrate-binding protein
MDYTVETNFFAGADIAVAALSRGDTDIGNGSTRTYWAAVAKGAGIRTVMEQVSLLWSLVAKPEIENCTMLDGRRFALTSTSSLSSALSNAYFQKNCPGVKPEIILIADSRNRAAALQAGEIDATPLELSEVIELRRDAPSRFHELVNFAVTLPEIRGTGIHVNHAWATQHPDRVRDYLTAVLTVHRRTRENPRLLKEALGKYLEFDPARAQEIADAYLARDSWRVNGNLTRTAVAASLDFFIQTGSLPAGLNADQVSDLSYLDAVLQEMGRK